jgi:hypothetical protein
MKTIIKNAILLMAIVLYGASSIAQQIPFLNDDPVAISHLYYPNEGQIADKNGVLKPEILFHTETTYPKYFFQENLVSFVSFKRDSIVPDSSFRIDMEFYHFVPPTEDVTLTAQDENALFYNYYLPHCGAGVEEVHGNERLVYQDAYADIDVEFTSNASGLKGRFIIYPGANPDDILLKFTGQDIINENTDGSIQMYLESWNIKLPQTYAYQVNNGEATTLQWLPMWNHDGNGIVSIGTQGYDSSLPLIIEFGGPSSFASSSSGSAIPPYWSTYFGNNAYERVVDMVVDANENIFMVTNTDAISIYPTGGKWPVTKSSRNCLISRFGSFEDPIYLTYVGGSSYDFASSIAEEDVTSSITNQWVYVAGYTNSSNFNSENGTSNFNQTDQIDVDGFITRFTKEKGFLNWATFYGGNGDDYITDMKINKVNHELYFSGYTTSTDAGNATGNVNKFPIANKPGSFYQDFNQGGKDAFIGQYHTTNQTLDWSSYYGGDQDDYAYAIEFIANGSNADVYLAGTTITSAVASSISSPTMANSLGQFPLANPGGGAYFQSVLGSKTATTSLDGFIARFNTTRALTWASFYGGEKEDRIMDLAVNSHGVFTVGRTNSSASTSGNCIVNTSGKLPLCSTTSNGYNEGLHGFLYDVMITQFSASGELKWATCYGDDGNEGQYDNVSCATNTGGDLFVISDSKPLITGSTGITQKDFTGLYYQEDNEHIVENGYGSDVILTMFNNNYERTWATYFGGGCNGCTNNDGDEIASTIATYDNEWIVFGGFTYGDNTPIHDPNYSSPDPSAWFDGPTTSTNEDGFMTKIVTQNVATFLEELTQNGKLELLKGYPNPAKNELTLVLPYHEASEIEIAIYNSLGQLMKSQKLNATKTELRINISTLPKGMYFSKVITNQKDYVYSFVKE